MVGIHKQNYAEENRAGNGQYRIISDHLGSASLVVDTRNTWQGPQVIHRQYFKPYGEAIPIAGTSQTSVG